jgi:hypothetical protein
MEKEFVSYDLALAMKEFGFDEPCVATFHDNSGGEIEFTFGMFHHPKKNSEANTVSGTFIGKNGCYAPLYQQAFRWFREEFGLWVEMSQPKTWLLSISDKKQNKIILLEDYDNYVEPTSYEEAELACLKKLIQILNQNKEDDNKTNS